MTNEALGPPATSFRARSVETSQIAFLDDPDPPVEADPGAVVLTCANCGATMDERKCKLICRCGYFLSCSDYY
jgi:hypothetical protein